MKQSNWLQKLIHGNKDKAVIPEHYWSAVKNEDYGDSYPKVEAWLREISLQKSYKQERKFSSMRNYIMAHKMRLVYTVIILAVVIGACSMPVTQHETVGHMMTWTAPVNNDAAQKINSLSWIDKSNLSVSENDNNGKVETIYNLLLPNSTPEQVEAYKKDLENIKEITSIKVFPLEENVKRPLYSAALNKFFRINIDATKMTDQELEQEVARQLKEQGVENSAITFQTDENGRRIFRVSFEKMREGYKDGQLKDPKSFEINIQDGNNQEVIKHNIRTDVTDKFKNMSDEQIRQQVKAEHPDANLNDNDIIIERKDGNVMVKIEKERIQEK